VARQFAVGTESTAHVVARGAKVVALLADRIRQSGWLATGETLVL